MAHHTLASGLAVIVALVGCRQTPRGVEEPPAERPAGCPSAGARQFDFWLGSWQVRQEILGADGKMHPFEAESTVSLAAGGCALVEHWRGEVQFPWEGMEAPAMQHGLSVRAYDPATKSWRIHWLDSRHPAFGPAFEGRFDGTGRGVFTRTTSGAGGGELVTRIVFERRGRGAVHWELAVSRDAAASWTTLWTMDFRRPGHGRGHATGTDTAL